jgi:histidinol-phosphate aminotransferase
LREVLARQFEVKVENVIAGSGSEGIISNIIRTFLVDDDEVLTTEAAFLGFQVLARSRGVRYRTVPYRDWRYDLPALAAAITEKTKIIESEQSHGHDFHPPGVRSVLSFGAGTGSGDSG